MCMKFSSSLSIVSSVIVSYSACMRFSVVKFRFVSVLIISIVLFSVFSC